MSERPESPYLEIAVLCQEVLEEKTGLLTLVRLTDRLIVTAGSGSPEDLPPVPVNLVAVIGFKAGDARGRHNLSLKQETPSGLMLPAVTVPMFFEGEDRGARVILKLGLQAEQEGLYWFDVQLDERPITRIPLRVIYQRISAG